MLRDIFNSYRELPLWVQIWVSVILVPVNLVSLAFLDQPQGFLVAALAITGMALNLPIMVVERGFTKTMALPHLLCWIPLVILVAFLLGSGASLSPAYTSFLVLLLIIDVLSLAFDLWDGLSWYRERVAK